MVENNIIPVVAFYPRYSSLGYTDEERAEVAKQLLSLSQASFINQNQIQPSIHTWTSVSIICQHQPRNVVHHLQACTQSLEELTKLGVEDEEVDVEEEEEEANELSTISEEQGEL